MCFRMDEEPMAPENQSAPHFVLGGLRSYSIGILKDPASMHFMVTAILLPQRTAIRGPPPVIRNAGRRQGPANPISRCCFAQTLICRIIAVDRDPFYFCPSIGFNFPTALVASWTIFVPWARASPFKQKRFRHNSHSMNSPIYIQALPRTRLRLPRIHYTLLRLLSSSVTPDLSWHIIRSDRPCR